MVILPKIDKEDQMSVPYSMLKGIPKSTLAGGTAFILHVKLNTD